MLIFKKKKIRAYLNNLGDSKTAFDLLLCDCLDGSFKRKLRSYPFKRVNIHIDWYDDVKCIGMQGKYYAYYIDLQIYPDEYTISFDADEPDENTKTYPLESREQVYTTILNVIKTIHCRCS